MWRNRSHNSSTAVHKLPSLRLQSMRHSTKAWSTSRIVRCAQCLIIEKRASIPEIAIQPSNELVQFLEQPVQPQKVQEADQ